MEIPAKEQCRLLILALFYPSKLPPDKLARLIDDQLSGRSHLSRRWPGFLESLKLAQRHGWTRNHQPFENGGPSKSFTRSEPKDEAAIRRILGEEGV